MTRTTPAAVVFDLGNVLIGWDPHPAVAAAMGPDEATRFMSADDFDFSAYNHEQDLGRPWDEAEAALSRSHPHWHEHAIAYRTHFDLSLSELGDNVAVLRDLHGAGVRLHALTNWSQELFPRALERFDFLQLFETIVVSGEERVAKPDAQVFALLERRIGQPLTDCVFIDDNPKNVEAARAAGLDAVHLTEQVSLRAELRARGLPV